MEVHPVNVSIYKEFFTLVFLYRQKAGNNQRERRGTQKTYQICVVLIRNFEIWIVPDTGVRNRFGIRDRLRGLLSQR